MQVVVTTVCKMLVTSQRRVDVATRTIVVVLSRPMRRTKGAAKTFAVNVIVVET